MYEVVTFSEIPIPHRFRYKGDWWRKISDIDAVKVNVLGTVILSYSNNSRSAIYVNPKKYEFVGKYPTK